MKHLWRILLYAGLDRAEYDALGGEAFRQKTVQDSLSRIAPIRISANRSPISWNTA